MSTADPLALDAPVRTWLRRIDEIIADLPEHGSPDPAAHRRAARILSDLLAAEFTDPAPPGIEADELRLAGPDGPLRARRFRPAGSSGPLPTMLWLHGGGWVAGTIDELLNERTTADRALRSGVQIVALEYRLAPEHPFPAPVDDAVSALAALRARASELGSTRSVSASAATPPEPRSRRPPPSGSGTRAGGCIIRRSRCCPPRCARSAVRRIRGVAPPAWTARRTWPRSTARARRWRTALPSRPRTIAASPPR